ncbi:MAG TPA: flagellar export chaperone FlgN [Rugosimonospora sp.]|nr:flagellar export chaperone FlgN [Rugosimonospora sp.]
MGLTALSSVLWRMRELLELLLFKLEEEQVLLATGRARWLAHATREVELVLEQIRQVEVVRAAEAQVVALDLGLRTDASLGELAEVVPTPWSELLRQHRQAFITLTAEINSLADANRELLTTGLRAARETVLSVVGTGDTYGSRGEAVTGLRRAHLVDEAI